MSARETSPLPWTADTYGDEGEITDANGFTVARYRAVGPGYEEELHADDARLIVRCVNNYDALVRALMTCEQELTTQHAYVASNAAATASPMAREGRRARIAAVMDEVRAVLAVATIRADGEREGPT